MIFFSKNYYFYKFKEGLDPGSGSVLRFLCWIRTVSGSGLNECGFETLMVLHIS
jgi:hypothetical protein